MTNLSDVGGLYQSIPSNMKDARTKAFMYACDKQIKKLLDRAEKIKVWCAIDSVDDKYLDYLAADCRALFYNSLLAPDVKRKLIINSYYWYMKLGTSAAMEEMIDTIFQNNDTTVEEWYTYAGDAYHFRVATSSTVTTVAINEFLKYINEVKNARSIFDYLVLQSGSVILLENDTEVYKTDYESTSEDLHCGTNPDYAVNLMLEEEGLTLVNKDDNYNVDYEQTGTYPDYAMGLELSEMSLNLTSSDLSTINDYNMTGETESGTYPDDAVGLILENMTLTELSGNDDVPFDYNMTGETESGTFP